MSEQNEFDDSGALAAAFADETTPGVEVEPLADPETADTSVPEGTVLVAMRRGHKFVLPNPEGEDLVIAQEPVPVPEVALKGLIKASNGRLFVVHETKED